MTPEDALARFNVFTGVLDDGSARARRRAHVLRVATELFSQQGYRKTSMDEVARKAGVAKGTVYTYYATKVDLAVAAIALEKREHMGEMLEWLDPERSAEQRLRAVLLGMVVMPVRMPLTAALLRGDQEMATLMAELPPELRAQSTRERNEFLGGLIDEVARPHGWTQSELDDRAAMIHGLAFISVHLHEPHARGGLSLERYAEILVDTIIAGLRSGSGSKGNQP
ncbi:MAG: TetR/AcrR family transcriptional regulator [Myxococcota bacterium]